MDQRFCCNFFMVLCDYDLVIYDTFYADKVLKVS